MVEREKGEPRAPQAPIKGGIVFRYSQVTQIQDNRTREEERVYDKEAHTTEPREEAGERKHGWRRERSVEGGGRNTSKAEYKRNRDPHQEGE